MNTQLEKIIKYLDNELSPSERTSFEEQIRKDKALAKEVAFQRGLHGFLNRNNPILEQELSELGDEFILDSKRKNNRFFLKIGIPILLLMGLVAYFLFFAEEKPSINNKVPPEIKKVEPTPAIEPEIKELPSNSKEVIKKEIIPIEEIKEPKEKTKEPKKTISQPIAALNKADFEPNPILENVIEENYRTDVVESTTIVTVPVQDAVFKYDDVSLIVNGQSDAKPNYRLVIYSNRSYDIENDYKMLDAPLTTTADKEQYKFRFNGNIPLKRGLYYLVIKKEGSRDILHISRFSVK